MTTMDTEHRTPATAAGWHPDPRAEHQLRYFDGRAWTEHVTHYGPTPCTGCRPSRS